MNHEWPLINDNITKEDKQDLINFLSQDGVRLTQGAKVKEFEKEWSNWLGVKHSVFVNSGASANYIMTAIVRDIKGKGEVIVPPLGWVSDIAPVVNLGLTPVFVDIDERSLAITAENIRDAITDETVAIVFVHVLGINGLTDEILKIAEDHDLILIEDCCESHGATFKGKKVGNFGDVSNFSFYFGHHMSTIEGGMVCTNDPFIYEMAKLYRSHGMIRDSETSTKIAYSEKYPRLNPLFTFAVPGFNMRSTELNAVIGLSQLPKLNKAIEERTVNFVAWTECLDSEYFYTDYNLEGSSNFSLPLVLRTANEELFSAICLLLEAEKIEFRKGTAGGGNQANQPYLENYTYRISGNLKNTDHIHDSGLYIGNHSEVTKDMISDICNKLNAMARRRND